MKQLLAVAGGASDFTRAEVITSAYIMDPKSPQIHEAFSYLNIIGCAFTRSPHLKSLWNSVDEDTMNAFQLQALVMFTLLQKEIDEDLVQLAFERLEAILVRARMPRSAMQGLLAIYKGSTIWYQKLREGLADIDPPEWLRGR